MPPFFEGISRLPYKGWEGLLLLESQLQDPADNLQGIQSFLIVKHLKSPIREHGKSFYYSVRLDATLYRIYL